MPQTVSKHSNSLGAYLRDIGSSGPISKEEERVLLRQVGQGDSVARDRVIKANLRFVVSVAREYRNRGMSMADLVSAGNLGLMTAVGRFDYKRGVKFISYAVWWIRQSILRSLMDDVRLIRLPINKVGLLSRISEASREIFRAQGVEPSRSAIAEKLGVSVEVVADTLARARGALSLNAPCWADAAAELLEQVPDASVQAPDEQVLDASVRNQVEKVLLTLGEREAEVLRLCFGMGGRSPMTLAEIGSQYGLSKERVRQIKEKALGRLRQGRRRRALEPLLDSVEPSDEAIRGRRAATAMRRRSGSRCVQAGARP